MRLFGSHAGTVLLDDPDGVVQRDRRCGSTEEPQAGAEPSEAELVAFAKERIGSVKAPKQVHVWPDLPRSTVGKVLKTTIRERLLGG